MDAKEIESDTSMNQNDFENMVKHIEELVGENGFAEETLEEVNKYIAENAKSDVDKIKAKISKNFNDLGNKYRFSNSKEAVKYFKIATDLGNTNGMVNYGGMLQFGLGIEMNPKEAAKYYKMAVDKGNTFGVISYANLLASGLGVNKDKEEAVKYWKMAADLGDINATVRYANYILNEEGVEYNKEEAEQYLKIAADKGNREGILSYIDLLKSKNNLEEAKKYYEILIKKMDTIAILKYAEELRRGDGFTQDLKEAVKYYKMVVDIGNIKATLYYAYMLENGEGVKQNSEEAVKYYKMAIEKGNSHDIYSFAFNLEKGKNGVKKDYKKALEFYQAAIDKGCDYCYSNMGNIYLNGGYGVEKDCNKAVEYFKKAAELGNKDAVYNLGVCYKNGYGVEENYEKALEYYKKAAEKNQPDAINALGNWYNFGYGGAEIDYKKANEYYKKAADLGCADAVYNLGNIYLNGLGVEINKAKALEYYEKAAELGNTNAIEMIFLYEKNELYNKVGLSKLEKYCQIAVNNGDDIYYILFAEICLENGEIKKALDYYKKAVEKGDSEALMFFGSAYYKGEYGFEKSEEKALEYFNKVVDNDKVGYYTNKIAENFLNEKNGFEKDFEKAKYFYEKAAEKGNAEAMYELGDIYFYGEYDVEADRDLAVKYFKGAAEKGESRSAFRIATIYDSQENLDEAIKYYKIAIQGGSTYAAINLAYLYENGLGVEKNEAEAARLYGTVKDPKFIFDLAQGYEKGELEKQDFERAKRFYEIAKDRKYKVDEKKFSELDKVILEESEEQKSIDKRSDDYRKVKKDLYKDIEEEAKKSNKKDYTTVDAVEQLINKYNRKLELTKEMTKRLESTKEFVKSPITIRNIAKCINNKEKNPTVTDIIPMLDYISNKKDITTDVVFRSMTLPAIRVSDKEYKGFGARMLNSEDNKIRLCFNEDGFIVEQLEKMGLKEEAEIFKNGAIIIDGQGKLSQKDINEFHLKFKVSPIEAYLDICEKGAKINYSNDKKSFDGQEVADEFKNKIANGLATTTESYRILADISRYSENINKSGDEEYKQIAEFIKTYSSEILKKTEVDEEISNGCQIKSSFVVAKQAVELLKAMDNAVNGKTNSIEQAQTLRDLATIKFNADSNDEKYKKEYFINCVNKTVSNNLGTVDRHLSAKLVKNKSKASGYSMQR